MKYLHDVYFENESNVHLQKTLNSLYKSSFDTTCEKAHNSYTIFTDKYKHPIGVVSLTKTNVGDRGLFIDVFLLPRVRGENYVFQVIKLIIKDHRPITIGWTIHEPDTLLKEI